MSEEPLQLTIVNVITAELRREAIPGPRAYDRAHRASAACVCCDKHEVFLDRSVEYEAALKAGLACQTEAPEKTLPIVDADFAQAVARGHEHL
jgi:hypothetical protein